MSRTLCAAIALILLSVRGAQAADSDVEKRLSDVERKQDEIFKQVNSEQGKVTTFLNDRISLGGFSETALTGLWGPQTKTQFAETPTNFALNLAVDFNEEVRFVSQTLATVQFPLSNPDNDFDAPSVGLPNTRQFDLLTTSLSLPQAYIEIGTNPEFSLQVGRGYVPFGIAFQNRDLVLFRRRGGPQMINANNPGNIVIAAATWSGAHLTGTVRLKEGQWGYDAYSLTPASNPSTMGGGARLWVDATSHLTLGASTQVFKRHGFTSTTVGADLKYKNGAMGMDAEWATDYTASGFGVSTSYYAEPYVTLFNEKFLIYLAADYLGNPEGETIGPFSTGPASFTTPDPFQKWELGGGVNWLPYSFTRFRLGLLYNDYVGSTDDTGDSERNYFSLDVSAGVEF